MFLWLVMYHFQHNWIDAKSTTQTTARDEREVIVAATTHANAIAAVKAQITPPTGGTVLIQNVNCIGGPAQITGS